jgi:hypothetical protein
MHDLVDELDGQEVGRARRHEQRAGHASGGECRPHDVAAEPPRRRIVRLRIVERRQVADDGKDDAGTACGVRRREWRQHGIGKCRGVSYQQRAAAERAHQQQRDAAAQTALLIAEGEHECAAHQPDGGAGEAGQRPGNGRAGELEARLGEIGRREQHVGREQRGQRQPDQADGWIRQRLGHQRRDHAGEQREIEPRVLRQAGGRRQSGQRECYEHRNHRPPQMDKPADCWLGGTEVNDVLTHGRITVNCLITSHKECSG